NQGAPLRRDRRGYQPDQEPQLSDEWSTDQCLRQAAGPLAMRGVARLRDFLNDLSGLEWTAGGPADSAGRTEDGLHGLPQPASYGKYAATRAGRPADRQAEACR